MLTITYSFYLMLNFGLYFTSMDYSRTHTYTVWTRFKHQKNITYLLQSNKSKIKKVKSNWEAGFRHTYRVLVPEMLLPMVLAESWKPKSYKFTRNWYLHCYKAMDILDLISACINGHNIFVVIVLLFPTCRWLKEMWRNHQGNVMFFFPGIT
jgi:hypothetical protein